MKKRAKAQKIGTQGENAFRDFADRNGLVVTKATEDFGTDFFCVVESPPNNVGVSTITGNVIGAFVRTTTERRPRIRIDRSDAGHLLSAAFPMCIVMIYRPRTADERTFIRYVDRDTAVRLAEFLKGDQRTLTLRSSDLLEEAEFPRLTAAAMQPGFVEGVRIFLASESLKDVLPRSTIEVRRGSDGQLTVVEMERFGEQFSISGAAHQELLHTAVFGLKGHMADRFSALPIDPKIETWIKQFPQPIAFVGPMVSHETTLLAEGKDGSASCHFEVRHSKDHFGYVHDSGFAITVSAAKPHGNEMVHFLKAEIDQKATSPISNFPELWNFLEKCTPDATVTDGQLRLPVENISWLPQCGFFARYLRNVQDLLDWPSDTWILADALSFETLNTLAWLCQTKNGLKWLQGIGLIVEGDPETGEEPRSLSVPICANLPRATVITWLRADGKLFSSDQHIRGFRLTRIIGPELELRDGRLTKGDMPELVFHSGWPTIRLGEGSLGDPAPEEWNLEAVIDGNPA